MLIVMNVLVITTAVVLGWLSGQVAADVVKERLVREVARNTAGVIRDRRLPFSDAMMNSLSEMFGMNFATARLVDGEILGSSFPPGLTDELHQQIGRIGPRGTIVLNDQRYLVDSHQITRKDGRTGLDEQIQLCAMASHEQFQDARKKTFDRIAGLALPAVVIATLLAIGLSFTITSPIRKLADEMDRLSETQTQSDSSDSPRSERLSAFGRYGARGPTEVASLAASFERLIGHLDETQFQLARSERLAALGKVAASVAHELRNPLSGIKMNVRVLKDELADRSVDDAGLDLILREIDRMDLYLKELTGISGTARSDNSDRSSREDFSPIRLPELIDSALSLMSGRCKHAGVDISLEDPPPTPPVWANGDQLRQVLINMIVNAIEAMPGGGRITVSLENIEGPSVRLWVRDTGPGVQVADNSDIFELFTSTKGDNAGMGLYISRRIILANGGRIGCDSSDDGAEFWFELPAADGNSYNQHA
jgi:signal transduction histidine kinase